jgi:manganese/zinc/iron transport system substrate-binding protein
MFARRSILTALLATSMTLGFSQARFAKSKIKVVARSGMIADAARVLSGEMVEVLALMGPGLIRSPTERHPFDMPAL